MTRDEFFPFKKTAITRPVLHLFFGNIGQKNVFYDILEQKNAFLGSKNKKFKKTNK